MSSRKVKGGRFRTLIGKYYAAPGSGTVNDRKRAYIYTQAEVLALRKGRSFSSRFGDKSQGTWELVYEQSK